MVHLPYSLSFMTTTMTDHHHLSAAVNGTWTTTSLIMGFSALLSCDSTWTFTETRTDQESPLGELNISVHNVHTFVKLLNTHMQSVRRGRNRLFGLVHTAHD